MSNPGNSYNGFTERERLFKFKVMKRLIAAGSVAEARGPCALCNDPEVPVEYHDEDHGEPFIWVEPTMIALCSHCHWNKLHKRFWNHDAWNAFIAHVRRGGYARELKDPGVRREMAAYRAAVARGDRFELKGLRKYPRIIGQEWFAGLRMDPESLSDPSARPRP